MNKTKKVEILYRMAKGQAYNASHADLRELSKYKVNPGEDAGYATRENISNYISAVDNGYHISFYDWCMNNLKGDRRRKGMSERAIAADNSERNWAAIGAGWVTWGLALYWMADGNMSVGACAIVGAVISVLLMKFARRWAAFTILLVPLLLAMYFFEN